MLGEPSYTSYKHLSLSLADSEKAFLWSQAEGNHPEDCDLQRKA